MSEVIDHGEVVEIIAGPEWRARNASGVMGDIDPRFLGHGMPTVASLRGRPRRPREDEVIAFSTVGHEATDTEASAPAGALRDASVARPFRVRISPIPTVVDEDGAPVPRAQVLEISFPGDTVSVPSGPRNVVTGPGVAKILVGNITIRGIPLC